MRFFLATLSILLLVGCKPTEPPVAEEQTVPPPVTEAEPTIGPEPEEEQIDPLFEDDLDLAIEAIGYLEELGVE